MTDRSTAAAPTTAPAAAALETFTAADAVELAVLERSGFVESRHLGSAVVLAPDGAVARALGDTSTPILPRSTLKPVQAATAIALGADLTGPQLALATASHSGTDAHVAVVREMLTSGGLGEQDLRCPVAAPSDSATRSAMTLRDEAPSRLRMNCSGKHAAMLLACRAQGWSTHDYLDPAHPLQRATLALLERVAGERVAATAIDGCGAPVHALSLVALARTIRWATTASADAADGRDRAVARVIAAVHADPWAIDGPGRENTEVIERLGTFAKGGAEGVMVMAAPDGHVVALKVLDGGARATSVAALALLVAQGALAADAVAALATLPTDVRGGDAVVGRLRPTL
ncbi:asparaginase [Litorihabitans aurantiacus]|uniref:Asparaginase n=1 Tax=Litorihabitans aurantiacus TaxID=1930061 RepID=A0AA37XCK4_9MICO|nr:asparaginase [Litorihabitans aurantiacus]GMA30226.1 asparaginase [Litorihabitans aurantiacus]